MYKAIVIDDEADARNVMRRLIELFCPRITAVAEAENAARARSLVAKQLFDFAFVDIQLNGESGIELAKEISPDCRNIIFVTAYDKYAVEAFQTEAIHYLLKPVEPDLLQQAVERATFGDSTAEDKMKGKLFLNTKERMTVLRYDEIIYVVGDGNYATFYDKAGGSLMVSHNLAYYQDQIDSSDFYRIHQSYLINLGFVRGVSPRDKQGNYSVDMLNGVSLPLARGKKRDLINLLAGNSI
jgi:two-component system LytT family response regulator